MLGLLLLSLPALAFDRVITNGSDLWRTPGDGTTFADFSKQPLPAGFFCNKSQAFTGRIILQAPPFAEFVETVDLDCGIPDSRCLPGDDIETVRSALVLGIRDYARKNNFTRVLLGLSGGIDSALVAALAAEAVGPENVLALTMPSPYSSQGSVDDSMELSRRLGIECRVRPISDAFHALRNDLGLPEPSIKTKGATEIAVENLQSRLRGNILMTISNAEGRLLLSTGNKSELALGYCTLYGDTNGGLAVIGDVLKTEVYEMARLFNRERELIPWSIILSRRHCRCTVL